MGIIGSKAHIEYTIMIPQDAAPYPVRKYFLHSPYTVPVYDPDHQNVTHTLPICQIIRTKNLTPGIKCMVVLIIYQISPRVSDQDPDSPCQLKDCKNLSLYKSPFHHSLLFPVRSSTTFCISAKISPDERIRNFPYTSPR